MKASKIIEQLTQDIAETGRDIEVACAYLTELELKNLYGETPEDKIKTLFKEAEDIADVALVSFIADEMN